MIPYFPKQFSSKAILIYFASLATVSLIFFRYVMNLDFIITKDGREYKKNRVAVFNLSPREVRIELEKAINNQ